MTTLDPSLRSPASTALLSAALGGLLCLTQSCTDGGTGTPDGGTMDVIPPCDVAPDRVVTVEDAGPSPVTLESFTANCNTLGGFIEIAPECGGRNTCRGISYDQETSTLSEHNCAGLNTCQGFTCILP